MAMARFSSSTTTSMACFSSSTTMEDTLAGEFVGHRIDAGATHTDASANGVHALVVAQHGDLGARAGVTGAGLDFQQALFDLRHFVAEEFDHELGGRARQDD